MIIDLQKYLFVGAKEDLADFFVKSQEAGFIEFLTDRSRRGKEQPEPIRKLIDAIKILRKQPVKDPYKQGDNLDFAQEIAAQVLDLTHEIEKLSEEQRFLQSEITRVAPFGQFSFDDIAFIEEKGKKKVQFFCVKTSKTHELEIAKDLIYVGTDYDLDYFIGIHDQLVSYPGLIEMQFDRTVGELKNHLLFVDETLHLIEAELKGYAGYLDFLRESLLGEIDAHAIEKTQKDVQYPIEGAIFSIEGWVPKNKIEHLPALVESKAIFFEPVATEADEKVPTLMENENFSRLGEDLVRIYDIPAATDKDPSSWVLWAFALFFAMILADGGYGLLYLGLAFFLKYKLPSLKASGKRFLKLLFVLATSCIIWGVLTTSFFGIEVRPTSALSKVSIIDTIAAKKAEFHRVQDDATHKEWVAKYPSISQAKDGKEMLIKAVKEKNGKKQYEMLEEFSDNILLELSLLIGVIHVCLSLARYLPRKWANIGWIAFAVGGYLYFPVTLNATSMAEFLGFVQKDTAEMVGMQLLYGGIGAAYLLALIQFRWRGLAEIPEVIQIFADILSYLRLYALALASTIMARTFNSMGANVGLVLGSLIILAGHSINLLLGTMGGVIHGLRLNFIEWYHYSFEGEGRLFDPLRKLKIKQE